MWFNLILFSVMSVCAYDAHANLKWTHVNMPNDITFLIYKIKLSKSIHDQQMLTVYITRSASWSCVFYLKKEEGKLMVHAHGQQMLLTVGITHDQQPLLVMWCIHARSAMVADRENRGRSATVADRVQHAHMHMVSTLLTMCMWQFFFLFFIIKDKT